MRTSEIFLVCSLLLAGCASKSRSSVGGDSSSDDASSSDTALASDTASDGEDTAAPEVPLDADFVMNSVLLLPSTEGFDLTGDGVPNNALAELFENDLIGEALGGSPNGYIESSVQRGELLVMLDFQGLGSLENDDHASIDMLLGAGGRGEALFDGDAELQVRCGSLGSDGGAASTFDSVEVRSGDLVGDSGEFLFLMPFAIDTTVLLRQSRIEARMDAENERIGDGVLGGSVSFSDLEQVVYNDPEIGPDFAAIMLAVLRALLDVDQDGDGELDALSAMFEFTAVSANIDREQPCVED